VIFPKIHVQIYEPVFFFTLFILRYIGIGRSDIGRTLYKNLRLIY